MFKIKGVIGPLYNNKSLYVGILSVNYAFLYSCVIKNNEEIVNILRIKK